MPTLLGMYDALLDNNKNISSDVHHKISNQQKNASSFKKAVQMNQFTNLSPTVQKMLANISDQNDNLDTTVNNCTEDHSCNTIIKSSSVQKVSRYLEGQKCAYSSARLHRLSRYSDQNMSSHLNKSTECLSVICDNVTPNVQKMLSNIPDQDLVISPYTDSLQQVYKEVLCDKNSDNLSSTKTLLNEVNRTDNSSFLYKISNSSVKTSVRENEEVRIGDTVRRTTSFNIQQVTSSSINSECNFRTNKSLSPQLTSGHKFKSRTIPGNYLQVIIKIQLH